MSGIRKHKKYMACSAIVLHVFLFSLRSSLQEPMDIFLQRLGNCENSLRSNNSQFKPISLLEYITCVQLLLRSAAPIKRHGSTSTGML